jgi:hypothetical protein
MLDDWLNKAFKQSLAKRQRLQHGKMTLSDWMAEF